MSNATAIEGVPPVEGLDGVAKAAAILAATCAIGLALYHALSTSKPAADYETLVGNAREVAFFAYLVSSIAALHFARHARFATTRPTRLIGVGYALVAFGVAAGFVLRDDPDWFVVVGVPGNLLAISGWIALGITSTKRDLLPRWAAVLGAVGGVFAVLFAEFGSGVLIGSFWLYLAFRRKP
jgi:hypothetical protein